MNNKIVYATIAEAEDAYMRYIMKHKDLVCRVWDRFKTLNVLKKLYSIDYYTDNISDIDECIHLHDSSKLSKAEFNAYRKKFYPSTADIKTNTEKEEFDKALKHHYENNSHHLQHFIHHKTLWNPDVDLSIDRINLRTTDCIDMVCDWIAMAITDGNPVNNYWLRNRNIFDITLNTKYCIDRLYAIYLGELV